MLFDTYLSSDMELVNKVLNMHLRFSEGEMDINIDEFIQFVSNIKSELKEI